MKTPGNRRTSLDAQLEKEKLILHVPLYIAVNVTR